jgi:hypothetical protein
MTKMIGIGIPSIHKSTPRPIFISCKLPLRQRLQVKIVPKYTVVKQIVVKKIAVEFHTTLGAKALLKEGIDVDTTKDIGDLLVVPMINTVHLAATYRRAKQHDNCRNGQNGTDARFRYAHAAHPTCLAAHPTSLASLLDARISRHRGLGTRRAAFRRN